MTVCFTNAKIIRQHQILAEDLWVSKGKIISPQLKADKKIDVGGNLIAPGYIDVQINGAFGADFTSSLKELQKVAQFLPQYGVTAFLPTLISTTPERYRELIPDFRPCEGALPLGIHLEGPFLNPRQAGAHQKQHFRQFLDLNCLKECYGSFENVKIVTLAPELPGAFELLPQLLERGIIVAAGHTEASYETMEKAAHAGIRLATHLFNAMGPFHHRAPGVIGAALTYPGFFYTMIADGIHVHPAALKLAWRAHPAGLILISDAMLALGANDGDYLFADTPVHVAGNRAVVTGTGNMAGSLLTLDAAVRYLRAATNCSIVDAVEAASLKPAQLLRLTQKGHLEIGADADFNILTQDLEVEACYIGGIKQTG